MTDWTHTTYLSIPQWYAGKKIFITGGTGFMGKVLIEKLLRSCPDLDTLYILIRPKKGQDIDQRLEQSFKDPLYDLLRESKPNAFSKVVPVVGDISIPMLGMSDKDKNILKDNVDIVFHSAATIKFNEELAKAIDLNILGTKRMLELASTMVNLEAFVHVSTAYAYCQQKELEEKSYRTSAKVENIIHLSEILDGKILTEITPKLLEGRPNTYTFTKALAEQMIVENDYNFPIAIFRPSIITGIWKDPLPGWVDNTNGPTGMIIGIGSGLLRNFYGKKEAIADMVPVDCCVNSLISIAWKTANARIPLKFYNYVSGMANPVTWGEMKTRVLITVREYPHENLFWYPNVVMVNSRISNNLRNTMNINLAAYIADFFKRLMGQKPRLIKLSHRIQSMSEVLEFFTSRDWNFQTTSMDLFAEMSADDKKIFYFDLKDLNWSKYIQQIVIGTKMYILKEDIGKMCQARKKLNRLYFLDLITKTTLIMLTWKILIDPTLLGKQLRIWGYENIMKIVSYLSNIKQLAIARTY